MQAGGSRLSPESLTPCRSCFLHEGYSTPEKFKAELSLARSAFRTDPPAQIPIGVGYLGRLLEEPGSPALELLQIGLDSRVKAVWFAFGNQLGRWVQFVRDHDQKAGHEHKTLVFAQISSVEEALVAIHEWKVDVVVAQGSPPFAAVSQ